MYLYTFKCVSANLNSYNVKRCSFSGSCLIQYGTAGFRISDWSSVDNHTNYLNFDKTHGFRNRIRTEVDTDLNRIWACCCGGIVVAVSLPTSFDLWTRTAAHRPDRKDVLFPPVIPTFSDTPCQTVESAAFLVVRWKLADEAADTTSCFGGPTVNKMSDFKNL